MKETSSTLTKVAMKLFDNPPLCSSCGSPLNFVVRVTSHHLHITNFRPVLSYNFKKECSKKKSYEFHFSSDELQSYDTIVQAVDDIVRTKLGLSRKLRTDQVAYIAKSLEMCRSFLLYDNSGRVSYYMEAHVDMDIINLREDILTSGALVRVKIKEEEREEEEEDDDDDTGSRCAVCLEGFDDDDDDSDDDDSGGVKEVYKTCCSHMFHCGCIGKWLTKKGDCPMCRFQLVRNDSEQNSDSIGSESV